MAAGHAFPPKSCCILVTGMIKELDNIQVENLYFAQSLHTFDLACNIVLQQV